MDDSSTLMEVHTYISTYSTYKIPAHLLKELAMAYEIAPYAVADPGFRKGRFHANTNAQPGLTCMITVRSNFHNASYN